MAGRLAEAVRKARKRSGLTLEEVGRRARVTGVYVHYLETGQKTNPSLGVLKRLARALNIPPTDLM